MKKILLSLAVLMVPVLAIAGDTYCFRVDMASFTQKQLNDFLLMGTPDDPDIFKQTYLLPASSYYFTLKITPKDDVEKAALLANVGQGFDILGVYNLASGTLQVKQENSKSLPNVKSVPATGVKP